MHLLVYGLCSGGAGGAWGDWQADASALQW